MGGAGSYAAGAGPAGWDPSYLDGPASGFTYPLAVVPDLAGVSLLDASRVSVPVTQPDGTFTSIHPVDQQATLRLMVEQSSLPSSPTFGQRYRKRLARLAPSKILNTVIDETNVTLGPMIRTGDIALVSVTVDTRVRGRVLIAVSYQNLRDPSRPPARTVNIATGA